MAPSARNRQAKKSFGEDVNTIVNPVVFILSRVNRRVNFLAEEGPARTQNRFIETLFKVKSRLGQQVPRKVFLHEGVIGDVRVESANHVVAIFIRVGDNKVAFVTTGFRVTHQVQPMSRPAFPELRSRQKPIHYPLPRHG